MQTSAELITSPDDVVPGTTRSSGSCVAGSATRAPTRSPPGDHRGGRRGRRRTHRRRLRRAGRRVRRRRCAGPSRRSASAIRRRGCVVVRGTFERDQAVAWDDELEGYLDRNDFMARYRGPADELFSALASSRPQIYGVYWSSDRGPPAPADGHRSPLPQLVLGPRVRRASVVRPRPRHRLPRPHPATPAEHPLARTVPARRPGRSSDGCSPPTSAPTATSSPATGTATTRGTAPTATRSTSSRPR